MYVGGNAAHALAATVLGSEGRAEGFNFHFCVFVFNSNTLGCAAVAGAVINTSCYIAGYSAETLVAAFCILFHDRTSVGHFSGIAGFFSISISLPFIRECTMSLYAIGDLHLSSSVNKPMDVFGSAWENYTSRIIEGFSTLGENDTTVLCGDLSWGMDLAQSLDDFKLIDSFPGKKIILKGNHDYWWNTVSKMKGFFESNGITSIDFLNNNCFEYGESAAVCGTRGWFYEEETGSEHDKKIMNRELMRLEASLKAAGEREKYVFLHYPPKFGSYTCVEILALFRKYGVKCCCAGHIHGKSLKYVFEGEYDGVYHKMVSADYVSFQPQLILGSA